MILFNLSIFFWDFYAGTETQGFGVLKPYKGIGMFYVYVTSYLSSMIVILGILRSNRFGMGLLIWTPYALIGLFVEAYFELILNPVLINYWGVIGWCVFGLITGLSADVSFFLLKNRTYFDIKVVSGIVGIVMTLTYYFTTLIAIGFFYKTGWEGGSFTDPGSFLGVAYFAFPWMILHAFLGGYTAYAIYFFKNRESQN